MTPFTELILSLGNDTVRQSHSSRVGGLGYGHKRGGSKSPKLFNRKYIEVGRLRAAATEWV